MTRTGSLACAAALALVCGTTAARADNVADFFRGRTVTIQVGFGAGGGYDITTRIVARHFGDHIPGKPTVVVQNLPGGGSMKLANYIYNAAPKDGTMLGVFTSAVSVERMPSFLISNTSGATSGSIGLRSPSLDKRSGAAEQSR